MNINKTALEDDTELGFDINRRAQTHDISSLLYVAMIGRGVSSDSLHSLAL